MKKVKDTSKQVYAILTKVVTIIWIVAIATGGLYVLDIVSLPGVVIKALGIGMLISATLVLYKSIK